MSPSSIHSVQFLYESDTQKNIILTCSELTKLLLRKNADYGDSAFKPPILAPTLSPLVAQRIRMSDKIERLSNLLSRESGPAVADETLSDTFMDLAGYCILQVMEIENEIHRTTPKKLATEYSIIDNNEPTPSPVVSIFPPGLTPYGSTNKVSKDPT